VSPRIVEATANGRAPADLTVTMVARALPRGWAAQKHKRALLEQMRSAAFANISTSCVSPWRPRAKVQDAPSRGHDIHNPSVRPESALTVLVISHCWPKGVVVAAALQYFIPADASLYAANVVARGKPSRPPV
jgi:hypothetical protein